MAVKLSIEDMGCWFDQYVIRVGTKNFISSTAKDMAPEARKALVASMRAKGSITPEEAKFLVEYAS